jgi:peptidoglycan/LPS O-acetylase OafA/YrhL
MSSNDFRRSIRYPLVDFARGFAMLTVVVFHVLKRLEVPSPWSKLIGFGGTGVHLFFVLSGFGLALSGRPKQVGLFFRRRLSRIWVPFVVMISISFILSVLPWFDGDFRAWATGVAGLHSFLPGEIESFGGHLWYVQTIAQLYLMFPVLMILEERFGIRKVLCGSTCISIAWWVVVISLQREEVRTWNSFGFQFLWEFVLGVSLAVVLRNGALNFDSSRWRFLKNPFVCLFIGSSGALIQFGLAEFAGRGGRVFNDVPALLGYGFLCIGTFLILNFPRLQLAQRFFVWAGSLSYPIYLGHMLVVISIGKVRSEIPALPLAFWFVAAMVLVFAVGMVLNKLFDFVDLLLAPKSFVPQPPRT